MREDPEERDDEARKEEPARHQETRHIGSVNRVDIVVNGKPRSVADGATISDLVAELGLTNRNVVVERNGEPLERTRFDRAIGDGDRLEIVRAVPGG